MSAYAPPAGLALVRAESDDDLRVMIAVRTSVNPDAFPTVENLRHHLDSEPGLAYFVGRLGGEPVACGFAGAFPGSENDPYLQADFSVVAEHRRRGIGSAVAAAVSRHARSLGKTGLTVEARDDAPEAIEFLEKRGYEEVERQKALALELGDLDVPAPEPPRGIEIVSRAERPDLERSMYEVGLEAGRDIPGLDGQNDPTFEQWRSFEIDRPSRRPEFTFLAVEGDEVVGYAVLDAFPKIAYHGLTGVKRAWRRRGVARALKLSQITAAKAAGYDRILTESQQDNEPMRRLNESLGFRPIPGTIVYRGPLLN